MRMLILMLLASLALGCTHAKCATEERTAAAAVESFVDALASLDVDRLVGMTAEDVTMFMPVGGPERLAGRDAVRAAFAALFAQVTTGRMNLTIKDLRVQTYGDVAVATFDVGGPQMASRRTVVLHCREGRWEVVHLHGSNVRR